MNKAYVMWQDEQSRDWFVVGCLDHDGNNYTFRYTEGAKKSTCFQPFPKMERLDQHYVSTDLFPVFANRLLPESRPEHKDFIRWLGLAGQEPHDIVLLARGEGQRETDSVTLHACPEKDEEGRYRSLFFSHGIRHGYLPENSEKRLETLRAGDQLFPAFDVQNVKDSNAILLRTGDPIQFTGYCPRYFAQDFKKLQLNTKDFRITVVQINLDAPSRFKLLCEASAEWPEGFTPCSGEDYKPIVK